MTSVARLRLKIHGITALADYRFATAPDAVATFRSWLPFEGELLQTIWSGHATSLALAADFELPRMETPVSLVDVGVLALTELGRELLIPYGPCFALTATGPQRVTRIADVAENREAFLRRLESLATAGAARLILEPA
jgi:hypothetical protein